MWKDIFPICALNGVYARMIDSTTLVMYEEAEEIQNHFVNGDNQIGEEFAILYYQYPGKGENWEMTEHIGLLYINGEDSPSTLTKSVWLPEAKHLEDMIPHMTLLELDDKFDDFKCMFYENHWFDNNTLYLEGRGEDPFNYFDTYDTLWLGFVMMDRYQKRWDRANWVTTDIYPSYFKMEKEIAQRDHYPDPDNLLYISGLRGYIEK